MLNRGNTDWRTEGVSILLMYSKDSATTACNRVVTKSVAECVVRCQHKVTDMFFYVWESGAGCVDVL